MVYRDEIGIIETTRQLRAAKKSSVILRELGILGTDPKELLGKINFVKLKEVLEGVDLKGNDNINIRIQRRSRMDNIFAPRGLEFDERAITPTLANCADQFDNSDKAIGFLRQLQSNLIFDEIDEARKKLLLIEANINGAREREDWSERADLLLGDIIDQTEETINFVAEVGANKYIGSDEEEIFISAANLISGMKSARIMQCFLERQDLG